MPKKSVRKRSSRVTARQPKVSYSYGYGKRPLWQWILLYVVIGGIIYFLIYYFVFAKSGGYKYNSQNSSPYNYSK